MSSIKLSRNLIIAPHFARRDWIWAGWLALVIVALVVSLLFLLKTTQDERDVFARKTVRATALQAFMDDSLRVALSNTALGKNATVQEVLDQANRRLHYAPLADAETISIIALELARTNLVLGRYPEAAQQIAMAQKILIPLGADVKRSRFEAALLALKLQTLQKVTAATEVTIRQLLNDISINFGASDPLLFEGSALLGDTLLAQGNTKDAAVFYRQTLAAPPSALAMDHPVRENSLIHLAQALITDGHSEEALKLLTHQHTELEKLYGANYPATLNALYQLALTQQARGNTETALVLYEQTISARGEMLGITHSDTLEAVQSQATLLLQTGQYARVISTLRPLLSALQVSESKMDPATPRIMNSLAEALEHQGNFDEAERILRRSLVIQDETQADSLEVFNTRNQLALLLMGKSELHNAEREFLGVLNAASEKLGAEHALVLKFANNYGECLLQLKRLKPAETLLLRSHEGLKKLYAPDHELVVKARARLADLYTALNQNDRAAQWKHPPPTVPGRKQK